MVVISFENRGCLWNSNASGELHFVSLMAEQLRYMKEVFFLPQAWFLINLLNKNTKQEMFLNSDIP